GPLALVDPGTLPGEAVAYLLEDPQRLIRLTSERELLEEPPSGRQAGGGLLALGGPEFDGPKAEGPSRGASFPDAPERFTACDDVKLRRFAPLPGSAAEVTAISARWRALTHSDSTRSVLLLLGSKAREHALRASCRDRLALHFATHGFTLHDDCEAWSPEAAAVFRTLYRTGLALAGANARSPHTDP